MILTRSRPLGVLGGMGPLATARFYETLVRATPAQRDQDHIRTIIWSDPSIPDRTDAIIDGGPSPVPEMIRGARALRRMGARVLVTPCNTAHHFLPEVARSTRMHVISMIDETMAIAAEAGYARVGVLATRGTRAARLYDRAGARHGIDVVHPAEAVQSELVDRTIRLVKQGRLARADELLAEAVLSLSRETDACIAACTELPLVMDSASGVTSMIDSIACLAEACAREMRVPSRSPAQRRPPV